MKKKLQVLHLEDDLQDALLIQERISSEGIDADYFVTDSEEQFKAWLNEKNLNLILSDYSIPGFSGRAALEITRNINADIPFIFISGTLGEELAVELLKSGATDYIIKDNLKRLVPAIRRALNEYDIVLRKREAEKELLETKHFLQRIVDTSPNVIYLNNIIHKRNHFLNKKITEILGYTFDEIMEIDEKFREVLFHPEDVQLALSAPEYYANNGTVFEKEYRMRHKLGHWVWIRTNETVFSKNKDGMPEIILGIAQDVTLKKAAEKELIAAKEKAEASDRLKSLFLAQMSHEIRTPLSTILNYASLLEMEFKDKITEDQNFIFNGIDSSGRRLIRTVDLILNMSAIQTGNYEMKPVHINIAEMLRKLMNEFYSHSVSKGISLTMDVNKGVENIVADEYTVYQIFQNLIDNAIKFTMKGKVELRLYKNNKGEVCIDVKDTGIGISPEFLPNLFKPFTQESGGYSRKFEGNGLGLALTKKYAEMNKADISLTSKKEAGTTVTVCFK